jgi:hypothetical protein
MARATAEPRIGDLISSTANGAGLYSGDDELVSQVRRGDIALVVGQPGEVFRWRWVLCNGNVCYVLPMNWRMVSDE